MSARVEPQKNSKGVSEHESILAVVNEKSYKQEVTHVTAVTLSDRFQKSAALQAPASYGSLELETQQLNRAHDW